jgi:5-methylcytosine-specific restriction endonuclease McrA
MRYQNNPKWESKRKYILGRDNYECKECSRYGSTTLANTVHHIIPIEADSKYQWLNENMISLCPSCHDAMHIRSSHELTERGNQLITRNLKKIEDAYKLKYPPHL